MLAREQKERSMTEPVKKSKRTRNIIIGVVVFILLYLFFALTLINRLGGVKGASGKNGIAVINVKGPIAASESDGLFSVAVTPESMISQLNAAEKDDRVAVVLLRVNSPGGTSSAGQEIYMQVRRLTKKKPVVVSIADIGASAAYLISSPADKIVATPSSLVGSIGTIIVIPNYSGLLNKIGIEYTVIAKGKFKDLGDPNRPLTNEERAILEQQSDVVYNQFIDDVAAARDMPRSEVEKLATGQAFLGIEGKENGLIDELGNYQDAIDLAAKIGKIKGEPEIIEYQKSSFFQTFSQILSGEKSKLKKEILEEFKGSPSSTPIK